ncbi:MAG: hypothetical protein JSW04_01685 [Desulfobacterales bacterium]|nr:MAG: hypothetical protein JSV38_04030 [Desulfobacterales bacterium]UCD90180.1 MAG: hypothetical protein JSW04_01685 [Desulfobacterales bacterium]
MTKTTQYKRLKRAFEHHCVVTGLFSPFKANVLIWLEATHSTQSYSSEERSQLVDYIWDHLWQLN